MRKKRIFSAFTALLAAVCVMWFYGGYGGMPRLDTLASADTELNGISVSSARVRTNSNFNVLITVPPKDVYIDTLELRIKFDPSVFEIVAWNPVLSGSEKGYSNTSGYATVVYASGGSGVKLNNGFSFTATLRAKSSASLGNYTIELSKYIVNSFDYGYRWVPETTSVTVKIVKDLVSLSGKVKTPTENSSAVVKLTDEEGKVTTASVTLNYNSITKLYEADYKFSDVEMGASYTMEITIPGCRPRTATIKPSTSNYSMGESVLYKPGDVDGNGIIEALDATHILRYLAGASSNIAVNGVVDEYVASVAHVETGGTLNIRDATQILRYLSLQSSVLNS